MTESWTKDSIRTLRLRLGWTQCDLARRLNLSPQIVTSWEEGHSMPESNFRHDLDFLATQATACNLEIKNNPVAERVCEETQISQIEVTPK